MPFTEDTLTCFLSYMEIAGLALFRTLMKIFLLNLAFIVLSELFGSLQSNIICLLHPSLDEFALQLSFQFANVRFWPFTGSYTCLSFVNRQDLR